MPKTSFFHLSIFIPFMPSNWGLGQNISNKLCRTFGLLINKWAPTYRTSPSKLSISTGSKKPPRSITSNEPLPSSSTMATTTPNLKMPAMPVWRKSTPPASKFLPTQAHHLQQPHRWGNQGGGFELAWELGEGGGQKVKQTGCGPVRDQPRWFLAVLRQRRF